MRTIHLPSHRIHMRSNLVGRGLGGLFSRLFRMVTPLVKTAARAARPYAKSALKELGKTGLEVAGSTLADVASGETNIKQALRSNLKRGAQRARKTVTDGAKGALSASYDSVKKDIKRRRQMGSGIRRKTSRKKRNVKKRRPYRGIFQ